MRTSIYLFSPSLDQAYVIAKFLKKYQPNCYIIGVEMPSENTNKNLKYIDELTSVSCLNISTLKGVLIPTGAISTEFLLDKGDIFLNKLILTQRALKVFNKIFLLSNAKKAGIPIPKTWVDINDIEDYPVFYKQHHEKGGGTRGIAHSKGDIPKKFKDELIFQELIVSKGTYGVSFLAMRGKILCHHMHFERESFPESGGSAVIIENFFDKMLLNHSTKLIKYLEYSGWGGVEFKYCSKRNNYILMEINAKFGASCELAFINEPKFLEKLFAISSKEKKIKRLFFIDRAIMSGKFIKNIILFYNSTQFRLYPGWVKKILLILLPDKYLATYKNYKLKKSDD